MNHVIILKKAKHFVMDKLSTTEPNLRIYKKGGSPLTYQLLYSRGSTALPTGIEKSNSE